MIHPIDHNISPLGHNGSMTSPSLDSRVIVAINNYNYAHFIADAIRSALNQSFRVDAILVIDDGSTDGSVDTILAFCRKDDRIALIQKSNGGQLSAFNALTTHVTDNDTVFMLDADDTYNYRHVEHTMAALEDGIDFYMTRPVKCLSQKDLERQSNALKDKAVTRTHAIIVRHSAYLSSVGRSWISVPTSGLAIRGVLLRQVLPYHEEPAWRTCADDVLALGSSIMGASKKLIADYAFNYRIHTQNHYAGRSLPRAQQRSNYLRRHRLIRHFTRKARLPMRFSAARLWSELNSLAPTAREAFFHEPYFRSIVRSALNPIVVPFYSHMERLDARLSQRARV